MPDVRRSHLRLWLRAEWDRILGTTLIAAGAVLLVVTYQGVANSRFVADQAAYLASGGLGGIFLLAVGAMLRIQADLHDEWRKLDRIEAALLGETLPQFEAARPDAAEPDVVLEPARAVPGTDAPRLRQPVGLAAVGLALAVAVAAAGFQHSANSGGADRAFGGLATGVVGVALAALVVAAYTMTLRHRIGSRKVALLAGYLTPDVGVAAPATTGHDRVLVGEGLSRFHLPGCPTLASARTTPVARADVGDLAPCAICGAH